MERLTYEIIDTGIAIDKDDVEEYELEDGIIVYKGNAVFRLRLTRTPDSLHRKSWN